MVTTSVFNIWDKLVSTFRKHPRHSSQQHQIKRKASWKRRLRIKYRCRNKKDPTQDWTLATANCCEKNCNKSDLFVNTFFPFYWLCLRWDEFLVAMEQKNHKLGKYWFSRESVIFNWNKQSHFNQSFLSHLVFSWLERTPRTINHKRLAQNNILLPETVFLSLSSKLHTKVHL